MPFEKACRELFDYPVDPEWMVINEQMENAYRGASRVVLAHASMWQPSAFAAAFAVWKVLCTHMGRAYIFSPTISPILIVRNLIESLLMQYPALAYSLTFDPFSISLTYDRERRIEWVHPDSLTDQKIRRMAGCHTFVYVDAAHDCANELLEALSSEIYPNQSMLIAGIPKSAHGTFKALYDDSAFWPVKLPDRGLTEPGAGSLDLLRREYGEDSDAFRSQVLAEFPQA